MEDRMAIIRPFIKHVFSEMAKYPDEESSARDAFYFRKNISHPTYFSIITRYFTHFNYYRGFIEGMRRTGLDDDTLIENCRNHLNENERFNGVHALFMEEILHFLLHKEKKHPNRFFSGRDRENLSYLLTALEKESLHNYLPSPK